MYCPSCGGEVEGGLTDCPRCEQPIPADLLSAGLLGLVLEGRYVVEQFISRGGMGSVYRGVDRSLSRPVAVKFLDERFHSDREVVSRFHREAIAAAALDHPNVVPIFSVGIHEPNHYFVMKFVDGGTIARLVGESGALPLGDALSIAIQVCQGLEHIHASGYVHRDIKPTNIMVSRRGHAYILDFGILRLLSSDLTQTGLVAGTPEYMSPEQARDAKSADARSDLYSLGAMLFEMLTGRPPFEAETAIDLLMKHLSEAPPRVTDYSPDLPPELDGVVLRALDKDRYRRYASAAQMADALQRVLTASGESVARRFFGPHQAARPASERAGGTLALGAKEAVAAGVGAPALSTAAAPREVRATGVRGESTAIQPAPSGRRTSAWLPAILVLVGGTIAVLALTLRQAPARPAGGDPPRAAASTADAGAVAGSRDAGPSVPRVAAKPAVRMGDAGPSADAATRVADAGGHVLQAPAGGASDAGGPRPPSGPRRVVAAVARVKVSSRPSGATVFLGRQRLGRTPLSKNVAPGTYLLTVGKSGYKSYRRKVVISASRPFLASAHLQALPARLIIVIQENGKLSYANITVDGKAYGRAPVLERRVKAGKHHIEVARTGFVSQRRTVQVAGGAREKAIFQLRRK